MAKLSFKFKSKTDSKSGEQLNYLNDPEKKENEKSRDNQRTQFGLRNLSGFVRDISGKAFSKIIKKQPPPPIQPEKEENEPPVMYTIFAGVNGAGKTSLYEVLKNVSDLGERVNIDEIVSNMGTWRDTLIQIKAGREAMAKINAFIERGISFHQETTLPGPTIIKQVKRAREGGFFVRLYYVGIDNLDTAINRVHRRVELGGHGIDDDIIRRRFEKLTENLRDLLPLCDRVVFYDNTIRFRQIAIMSSGILIDCDLDCPAWFKELNLT